MKNTEAALKATKENCMKHFIGNIREANGEKEYDNEIIVNIPEGMTETEVELSCKMAAKNWYAGITEEDWDDYDKAYWSDSALVFPLHLGNELTEEQYQMRVSNLWGSTAYVIVFPQLPDEPEEDGEDEFVEEDNG